MANIFNEQIPVGVVVDYAHKANEMAAQVNAARVDGPRTAHTRIKAALAAMDAQTVGRHFIEHYRRGAAERGHEAVARQLRKQGVPLEIARLILLGRAE